MFNNYLTTIPQVADNLRKGHSLSGYGFTPSEWSNPKNITLKNITPSDWSNMKNIAFKNTAYDRLTKNLSEKIKRENLMPSMSKSKSTVLESSNPANIDYWNRWHSEAVQKVMDGLENQDYSKKLLLAEKYYPKRNKNSSAMVFQTSQNMPSFSESKSLSGGNFSDFTESSQMADNDFEAYKAGIFQRRIKEFEQNVSQISSQPSFGPLMVPTQNLDMESNTIDFILSSIEEKIGGGIVDSTTYNDLMKVYGYYTSNIWKFEDASVLINLIKRLEQISINCDQIIKNKEDTELSGRDAKDIQFAELFLNTIQKLIDFINANISFIGRNQSERKILASSVSRQMSKQPSRNVLPSVNNQLEQQLSEAPEAPEAVVPPERQPKKTFRPSQMTTETLKEEAAKLGIEVYDIDSKDALRTLIWNKMNPTREPFPLTKRQINQRLKNPELYIPLVGLGRGRGRRGGNAADDFFNRLFATRPNAMNPYNW